MTKYCHNQEKLGDFVTAVEGDGDAWPASDKLDCEPATKRKSVANDYFKKNKKSKPPHQQNEID